MKKTSLFRIVAHFAFAFASVSTLCASEKTVVIGGEKGWGSLMVKKGLAAGKGRFGFESIELSTDSPLNDENTELYISFEDGKTEDLSGNYKITEANLLAVDDAAVRGRFAGLSRGDKKGLVLTAKNPTGSKEIKPGTSFTVEFWLCPSLAENGETVYSWRASLNHQKGADYQTVSAVFSGSRLEWKFKNIFPDFAQTEITLRGFTPVIPGEWSRHTVTYDEENGSLEYLVNGRTEDIKYITSTGHERGTICMPVTGTNEILEICPAFTGKIDNFCIQNSAYEKSRKDVFVTGTEKYSAEGGRFITQPVLASHGCILRKIEAVTSIPEQTELKFFVRSGDNCYGWSENYPEWKEVEPGEQIEGVAGIYFQIAAELLPDGNCSKTPSVTRLTLEYSEPEKPLPPFVVKAEPGDGHVVLSWGFSVDDNAGGYYVYYGTKPGEYLGRQALEGASPVNAGNSTSITLTGLKNGTIYYFAVSAYSRYDRRVTGELSKEVYARPSSVRRK